MIMEKNNLVAFPTDMVRAEVEIDRAHKRWLAVQKEERDNRPVDITIACENMDFSARCNYVNNDVYFPDYGVAEFHPSIFNLVESLAERYDIDGLINGEYDLE